MLPPDVFAILVSPVPFHIVQLLVAYTVLTLKLLQVLLASDVDALAAGEMRRYEVVQFLRPIHLHRWSKAVLAVRLAGVDVEAEETATMLCVLDAMLVCAELLFHILTIMLRSATFRYD
jgi:hypothetical protein